MTLYDKRVMFTLRVAKNLADKSHQEREEAYAQMNAEQYGLVSKAVSLLLSRRKAVS